MKNDEDEAMKSVGNQPKVAEILDSSDLEGLILQILNNDRS